MPGQFVSRVKLGQVPMKKIFVFLCICFSMNCFANSPLNQNTITAIVLHDFGNEVFIYTLSPITNQEGCQKNSVITLQKNHPFFKEMYSALLATYYAGGKFSGWVNGCNPILSSPILTRLDLVK